MTTALRRAPGVDPSGSIPARPVPDERDDDDDESEVASDGGSLSSEGEYERDTIDRLYRVPTVAAGDRSAYGMQLPPKHQRKGASGPESSRHGMPADRVVDYAAYTKSEARAELMQATSTTGAASPAKREVVKPELRAMYDAAFGGSSASKAANTTSASGGASSTNAASASAPSTSSAGHGAKFAYDGITKVERTEPMPAAPSKAQVSTEVGTSSRPGTSGGRANRLTSYKSGNGDAATPAADTRSLADRVLEKEAAREAAVRKVQLEALVALRAEEAAEQDPSRKEYLKMLVLLRQDALKPTPAEERAAAAPSGGDAADESANAATTTFVTEQQQQQQPEEAAADPAEERTVHDPAYEARLERVVEARRRQERGLDYDRSALEEANLFDSRAVASLLRLESEGATRLAAQQEAEETRRFYAAVDALEALVAGSELPRLINRLLERHRFLFQRSKPARERGEYTHEEHVAFREFSEAVQEFVFPRLAAAAGVPEAEFDIEEFFTKVFEAEDAGGTADGDDDDAVADYPALLSSDVWEVILAMLGFESFADLMDEYIFSRNNSSSSNSNASAAAVQASNSGNLAAAAAAAIAEAEEAEEADALAQRSESAVAGVDAFVADGRPVRRVGSADAPGMGSRQTSTAAVGATGTRDDSSTRRVSPPPPAAAGQSQTGRPAFATPPSSTSTGDASTTSAPSFLNRPVAPAGSSSLNRRQGGALPPVDAPVKGKGVALVPNSSLSRPARR